MASLRHRSTEPGKKDPRSPAERSWVIMTIGFLCSRVCLHVESGGRERSTIEEMSRGDGELGSCQSGLDPGSYKTHPRASHHSRHPWVLLITTWRHITNLNIFLQEPFMPSFPSFSSTAFICLISRALSSLSDC